MKLLLPWLCVLVLLIGLGLLYSNGQKKDAELAALREDSQQLQKLRAEQDEAKTAQAQTENNELARLRREHDELLRLRNEARQLRTDKQQLSSQVQTAQAQAQRAQEQVQAQPPNAGQPGAPAPADAAAQGASKARYEQMQLAACINNLRMIDGAKQQWALEKQKAPGALMTAADLAPYFRSNTMPACPAGGIYTLNPVNVPPICNIPGHALPR